MAGIRQTIELLLKILHCNGISKLKAETLRLAKLNSDEAVAPLWKLLFEILYYLKYDAVDDVTVKAHSELTQHELTAYVKAEMKLRGFRSKDFHALPVNMSAGSRELLLAFGWLLCHCNVIERFMRNCGSPLTAAVADGSSPSSQVKGGHELSQVLSQFSCAPMQSPENKLKHLKWLNGKLRMSLRQLHTLQQERSRLSSTVSKVTKGVKLSRGRDHLTPLEAALLQSPELLQHNLKLLDRDNARLECLLQWPGEHDEMFWRWMSSVLDTKLAAGGQLAVDSELSPRYDTPSHRQLEAKVNLMDAVRNYEAIIDHIESLYREQQHPQALDDDIDSLLASLEAEIAVQKASIALSLKEQMAAPQEEPGAASAYSIRRRAADRQKQAASKRAPSPVGRPAVFDETSTSSRDLPPEKADNIELQLNELQALMERLQRDIEFKKRACKDDISILSSDAEDVVVSHENTPHFRS